MKYQKVVFDLDERVHNYIAAEADSLGLTFETMMQLLVGQWARDTVESQRRAMGIIPVRLVPGAQPAPADAVSQDEMAKAMKAVTTQDYKAMSLCSQIMVKDQVEHGLI